MQSNYRDNYATTCGLVTEGTGANTFKTTQAVSFSIGGLAFYKAAADNLTFSAGHTSLAASQRCAFFVCLDNAGNVTTLQSAIFTPSPTGDQRAAAEIPNPTDKVVIGALIVTTSAAGVFVPNTTDLSAAGVTFTTTNYIGDYGTAPAM